eukprot:m.11513 g.11513  ORF g.11513 m.11513 type:complete len:121 (+) comp9830_c0_seq1:126-488(+)
MASTSNTDKQQSKDPSMMDRIADSSQQWAQDSSEKLQKLGAKSQANVETRVQAGREHMNDLAEGKHRKPTDTPHDDKGVAEHVQDFWDTTVQTAAKSVQWMDPKNKDKAPSTTTPESTSK